MPELPEVETTLRGLHPVLAGATLADVDQRCDRLRYPLPTGFAARLTGRRVAALARRGKYMLWHLDNGWTVLVHLGMSGRFVVVPTGDDRPPGPHDHLRLTTAAGAVLVLNDARRFGMVDMTTTDAVAAHPWLAHLGPEPLGSAFTAAGLARRLAGRRTPVKAALLDQTTVAGLGNIYVCEALYRAGIAPQRPAATIGRRRAGRLVAGVRAVLGEAIAAGGTSLRDYRHGTGELGYFQKQFAVYGRAGEACPACDCDPAVTGGIQRLVQTNRSSFYCPRRQR